MSKAVLQVLKQIDSRNFCQILAREFVWLNIQPKNLRLYIDFLSKDLKEKGFDLYVSMNGKTPSEYAHVGDKYLAIQYDEGDDKNIKVKTYAEFNMNNV